jgi:hypothetical protein
MLVTKSRRVAKHLLQTVEPSVTSVMSDPWHDKSVKATLILALCLDASMSIEHQPSLWLLH